MNQKHFSLIGLLATTTLTFQSEAAIVSIGNMSVTGGSFEVTDNSGSLIINTDFNSTITPLTFIGANTDLVSGYIGNNFGTDVIAATTWFGGDVSIYTAPTNPGDISTPAGSITGGAVPTGFLDDASQTIQLDLSAWFGNWAGFDVFSGTGKNDGITSSVATGTWNSITGDYVLNWDSVVDPVACGPFGPSCVAHWTMQGNASVVPIPGALLLFSSGIIALLGFTGLRKRQ